MHSQFYLTVFDVILVPLYLSIVLFLGYRTREKHIEEFPYYKYYLTGLLFKIAGGIAFSLIYNLYYRGGDALNYFQGALATCNVFYKNPIGFFALLSGNNSFENWLYFDSSTGFPLSSMYRLQKDAWAVSRFSTPFILLAFNSFLAGTILLDLFLYRFIWKFYTMLCELYPGMERQFAIAVLFIPSVSFWGSSFMKDTFTITAALYFTYNFYMIFIKKQKKIPNIIAMIINAYVMITIKPYVLVALLPAVLLWISYNKVHTIQNQTIRIFATPFLLIVGVGFSMGIFSLLGSSLGQYGSVETMLKKAQVTQQDLVRGEAYGEHKFDIGKFDATIGGILSKAPVAITAGLFRPFIWEAGNPVMLISGLENLILLVITIYIIFKTGPIKTFGYISSEPLLLFSITFALIIAFSCGLTAANFGALVRYKIPALPFFISVLFILYQKSNMYRKYPI